MSVRKSFGASPRRKIFVRVQEVEGQRILQTHSFSIWGQTVDEVATTVEEALDAAFGEEEEEEAPTMTVKKKKRRS